MYIYIYIRSSSHMFFWTSPANVEPKTPAKVCRQRVPFPLDHPRGVGHWRQGTCIATSLMLNTSSPGEIHQKLNVKLANSTTELLLMGLCLMGWNGIWVAMIWELNGIDSSKKWDYHGTWMAIIGDEWHIMGCMSHHEANSVGFMEIHRTSNYSNSN